ncbi:MAG TPA: translation initiation factor IF-3 [Arthrobacter sp.]|nr:translation initiation factor IF-3 [Arthrobacter sp.]
MNDRIRVPEVRLVGPAGEQVGIVRIEDALRLASESDLDLVEVAPMAKPPVAKLMDFGKYKYEAAVKAREARKNQTNTVLKEVRFRLKIDTHDYETKTGHARRFLSAGDKVKAMIQFRGREQQRPEMGIRLLQKFAEDVSDVGSVESNPRIDGRNMVMVIGPVKNKAEAKAEARRATQKSEAKAQKESKGRVDVSKGEAPMTQTLGDTMPEGLKAMGTEAERPAAEAEEQVKAPEAASTAKAEPKPAEAEKPAPKPAAEPAAPKPAAEPAAPKPAGKPAAPKPVGKPAAPKPRAGTSKPAGKTPSSQSKSDADK